MWFSVLLLLIIIALLLLLTLFHYGTNGRKYWMFKKVPYREPCPIFGNFGPMFTMRRSYTHMLQFFYDNYRNEKYVGIFQARRPTLMVIDMDIVKYILSTDFYSFGDRISVSTDTRREPLLRNLANMSGAEWKTMRQIVTPSFSSAKMKAMFPLIADCAEILKNVLLNDSVDEVDIPKLMTRYTTDVIGSCAFGVNPEALRDADSPFLKMSSKMFKTDRSTIWKRYCRTFFPRLFKFLNLRTYSSDVENFFTTIISQVLTERRNTGIQRNDFLQLMLNVQNSNNGFQMTDELITSNSFIFMLAGLETSATTLSFCLYELARAQELQDTIRQEIFECLGRYGGLNYDAVCAMRLTNQTVLETLRMHPPTPLTTRLCTSPCTLPNTELNIKLKDPVLIPIHCIQRDPRYFADPDRFQPDRFKDDSNPQGFMAFGDGPRSCPEEEVTPAITIVSRGYIQQDGPQKMSNKANSLLLVRQAALSRITAAAAPKLQHCRVLLSSESYLNSAFPYRATELVKVLELDVLAQLKENNFLESSLEILIDFCNEREYRNYLEPNVPLSMLDRRSELEVRAQKCGESQVSPSLTTHRGRPTPTAELVAALADVVHNTGAFARCPVQAWNELGLYRLLFRCCSWSSGTPYEFNTIRSSACRALFAAASHKCVRTTLAGTKDCLYNLLAILAPLKDDEWDTCYIEAHRQALQLLACLLAERSASETVWTELKDKKSKPFFSLLLQTLECEEVELQEAGLYCMSQLASSIAFKKHPDKSKDIAWVDLYDNLKSLYPNEESGERYGRGDGRPDCQPEYMAEELCKAVICLYQKTSLETKKYQTSQDDHWVRVCSCLCTVFSVSPRSRVYGVHRQLPRIVLATLQAVRDQLSVQGKPADVIRNANQNPVLRTLYWLLTVIDCLMVECPPAKEAFAEDNLTVSLARLWPWCMMTEQLRHAVVHLLFTFSNNSPKAWSCMSTCVGGRSLVGEMGSLASREAALQSRTRPDTLLLLCIHTLRRCLQHHQCRAILLKSEVLSSLYKLAIRERVRGVGTGGGGAGVAWARLCEAAARHADGAAALLALRPQLAALPPALRASLVPALAHAASHQRITFLQSPDLLELLSGTLLAGEMAEVISAARAAWSLAANNHKAKLQLRSAGVAAAVQSAVQRFQRSTDSSAQRALQLLTYTNTVLQVT